VHRGWKARAEKRLAVSHGLHAQVEALEFGCLRRSQRRAANTRAGAHVTVGGGAHGQRHARSASGPVELRDQVQAATGAAPDGVLGQDLTAGQEEDPGETWLPANVANRRRRTHERDPEFVGPCKVMVEECLAAGDSQRGPVKRGEPRRPQTLSTGLSISQLADDAV
jgi:hypothetical protein